MDEMKTSRNSWQVSIPCLLSRRTANSRIAIVGIGNTLRSDDAAGILVVRALMESRIVRDLDSVLVMDAGHAPENATGQLRNFQPDAVLLIDAAEMGELPGTIRLVRMDEIEGMSASTHTLPLAILAKYLVLELGCDVALVGIQPASTDFGENVHVNVFEAIGEIVQHILKNTLAADPV